MDAKRELGLRLQDLLKCMRLIKQSRAMERPGIPAGLLAQIDDLPAGCHARELAARTSLDPSTISRAVAALVAHGLVERLPDPHDGRASVLAVTPAGRVALADIADWLGRVLDRALSGWSAEEVAALTVALARFTHDIEASFASHDNLEVAR
ncbi:DNA-binding MarR family transcriptional regulator [Actinoplanes tereljensis]|uniref:MarR family transcriptional regulator n=1 Tax=Paractinoplanes tereljensis TaxID=571912 RepID=A0A919NX01_9ACTN|nr:MarR family winged helix-turn-helix transcriptional regulator [Actinoplanes tereljensis]GIF26785.1 MarR family transcriptional regulator [Actinoplanes tereljensis]